MRWVTPLDEILHRHNPFPILAAFTAPQNIASDALVLHSTELPYLAVPLCATLPLSMWTLSTLAFYGPYYIPFVCHPAQPAQPALPSPTSSLN